MNRSKNQQGGLRQQGGFTLLEVMVALAIAAVGLGAVSKALYQNIDVADRLSQKMIGTWVASNHLTELQLSRSYLSGGQDSASVSMAGREWQIQAEYAPTGDNEIVRVDVSVFEGDDRDRPAAKIFGFLAQPKN
ncbi:MAG: type II secretion system minor pseudopilin GspI [Arenicellales bacterium]